MSGKNAKIPMASLAILSPEPLSPPTYPAGRALLPSGWPALESTEPVPAWQQSGGRPGEWGRPLLQMSSPDSLPRTCLVAWAAPSWGRAGGGRPRCAPPAAWFGPGPSWVLCAVPGCGEGGLGEGRMVWNVGGVLWKRTAADSGEVHPQGRPVPGAVERMHPIGQGRRGQGQGY